MPGTAKEKVYRAFGWDKFRPYETVPEYADVDPFFEKEPTVQEFIHDYTPTPRAIGRYFLSLFPFLSWIGKYNLTWLTGDLIAG